MTASPPWGEIVGRKDSGLGRNNSGPGGRQAENGFRGRYNSGPGRNRFRPRGAPGRKRISDRVEFRPRPKSISAQGGARPKTDFGPSGISAQAEIDSGPGRKLPVLQFRPRPKSFRPRPKSILPQDEIDISPLPRYLLPAVQNMSLQCRRGFKQAKEHVESGRHQAGARAHAHVHARRQTRICMGICTRTHPAQVLC